MNKDLFTFLVAGKAGEGIRKAGTVALRIFSWMGREAFQMDDYQCLIGEEHNFSIVSTSLEMVFSH